MEDRYNRNRPHSALGNLTPLYGLPRLDPLSPLLALFPRVLHNGMVNRAGWTMGSLSLLALLAACQYATGDLAMPAGTPIPSYPPREVISADAAACEPQTVSGDSMVKTIMGWNLLTLEVSGPDGDHCLFDFANETGTGYSRFSCRVPRSSGRVVVYEFDKGVTDILGYRYGHTFSWDFDSCALTGCSEGTVFPADCPQR
jgi:hypothetical protein